MTRQTISEAVGKISTRHVEEAANYGKKHKAVWIKPAIAAACLCLALVGILCAKFGGTAQPENTASIVVNEVNGIATADMDAQLSYYDTLSDPDKETMLKNFEADTGFGYDNFTAKMPISFAISSFYSMDVPADNAKTEYVPHDYVFEYQTQNGGDIRIAICYGEKPLRDCFVECDSPRQSEVNGVYVTVYGYQGSYMTYFSHENIYYDIEAKSITQAELEEIITCLVSN